jgi:flagellar biosynthesis protein FliQ
MKIHTKIKLTSVAFIVLLAVGLSASIVGAVLVVTGNTLNFAPLQKPTLALTSNSTSTPWVGDTITLTATLSNSQAGVPVTFYINQAPLSTINTNGAGIAIVNYGVTSTTPIAIYPSATLP